jgi:hypothetical protein
MLLIAILADRDPASNIFILSERFEFTCLGFLLPVARFFRESAPHETYAGWFGSEDFIGEGVLS